MSSSFDEFLKSTEESIVETRADLQAAATKERERQQKLDRMAAHEWEELLSQMKQMTQDRTMDRMNFVWTDMGVQFGGIGMTLVKNRRNVHPFELRHVAIFRFPESPKEFTLTPELKGDELSWTAPGICPTNGAKTGQLADALLRRLVLYYTETAIKN